MESLSRSGQVQKMDFRKQQKDDSAWNGIGHEDCKDGIPSMAAKSVTTSLTVRIRAKRRASAYSVRSVVASGLRSGPPAQCWNRKCQRGLGYKVDLVTKITPV